MNGRRTIFRKQILDAIAMAAFAGDVLTCGGTGLRIEFVAAVLTMQVDRVVAILQNTPAAGAHDLRSRLLFRVGVLRKDIAREQGATSRSRRSKAALSSASDTGVNA